MTIDEMISWIEFVKVSTRDEPYSYWQLDEIEKDWDQVIAALRAGQQMRKAIDDIPHFQPFPRSLLLAAEAFDAATKGDV